MMTQVEKKARQYISLCNIIKRNSARPLPQCVGEGSSRRGNGGDEAGAGGVGGVGGASGKSNKRSGSLMIPFVIVQTAPDNDIHLEWRKEKKEALLRSAICVVLPCAIVRAHARTRVHACMHTCSRVLTLAYRLPLLPSLASSALLQVRQKLRAARRRHGLGIYGDGQG